MIYGGDEEMHSHHSCNESFGRMERKEILNEERKSEGKGCVKVVGLVVCLFYFIFIHFCSTYFLE
jgi:hypothetical protein